MTTNKSVADYVLEHLAIQDKTSDKEPDLVITSDANHVFTDTELAATLNAERLHQLLQECDGFLALAKDNISEFEDNTVKDMNEENEKTDTKD